MRGTRALLIAALLALGAPLAAETLGVTPRPALGEIGPDRGSTMQSVARDWGEPAVKRAAVGDPPITRWEYPEFVVYFEHDRVIHAVAKRRTAG